MLGVLQQTLLPYLSGASCANEVKLILYCKRRQEVIIESTDLSTDKMEMVLAKQLKSGISFNFIKQSIKN